MIQVLLVVLLSGITVRGQGNGPMLNLNQSIYYYNDCSFNASFFNSNCVFSSCSAFSGKCSPSSTECFTVSPVLNTCLMQNTVCEKPVGHLPICHFQVNLFGISARTVPNALTGTCVLQQGFIDNLNNATYCVTGSTPYTVKINAPSIYSNGNYGCTFAFFGSTIAAPNFNLKLYLDLSATATIDLSTQPPKISTVIDQSNIALDSFDFNGLPDILSASSQNVTLNYMFDTFGTNLAAANFLASYAASGLQAANQSCYT